MRSVVNGIVDLKYICISMLVDVDDALIGRVKVDRTFIRREFNASRTASSIDRQDDGASDFSFHCHQLSPACGSFFCLRDLAHYALAFRKEPPYKINVYRLRSTANIFIKNI